MRTGDRQALVFSTSMLLAALALWVFSLSGACAQGGPFDAASKVNVKSYISVNNTTAVAVKTTAGVVYGVEAFSNNAVIAYVKLYNTLVTCGTATPPIWRGMIPFGASSSGAGFGLPNVNGDAYFDGIYMCITTGIADTDTGAPVANAYIVNVHFK